MGNPNEQCSLCNQCEELDKALKLKIIEIADARLYNIRYELNRPVYYGLYKALRFYSHAVGDICSGNTCDFCYGSDLESILEKARMISV